MHAAHQEPGNPEDQYAVGIMKAGVGVVGHIPREISQICWMFLERDETVITCTVTGPRQRSVMLEQGGLEIPCIYTFKGKKKLINKLVKVLGKVDIRVLE